MKNKIFISVYQALPNFGSENHIGFYIINKLLKEDNFDLYLFTPVENRTAIKSFYSKDYPSNLHFIDFEYSFLLNIFKPDPTKYSQYMSNILWALNLKRYLRKNTTNFDLYYQINPSSFWSYNGLINQVRPTLLGPLMGYRMPRRGLWKYLNFPSKIFEMVRLIVIKSPYAFINKSRILKSDTHVFVGGDKNIFNNDKYINLSHSLSIEVDKIDRIKPKTPTIILAGRFTDIKGYEIAIEALGRVDREFIVNIYGDGPRENHIKNCIDKYNLSSKFNFKGHVSQDELIKDMSSSNLLIAPYIRDSASLLVSEALYSSLPVVTISETGPANVCSYFNPELSKISSGVGDKLIASLGEDITYFLDNFIDVDPKPASNFGDDIITEIKNILV